MYLIYIEGLYEVLCFPIPSVMLFMTGRNVTRCYVLWYNGTTHRPRMKITYDHPGENFTQVPNDLIASPHLTGSQKITWIKLASVCRNGNSVDFRSLAEVSRLLEMEPQRLRIELNRLIFAGGAAREEGDLRLLVPSKTAAEPTIQEEMQAEPKRKHSMTQKEAWELIKEGWNKDKPDSYVRLDGALNLPTYIAFETQAKRLGIEREDYSRFTAQVCRGAGADEWWSKQVMKASSIFGFGKVTDKKFENVEKLYKAGAKVESAIDYNCDADILTLYHNKGHNDLVSVVRHEAANRTEAENHLNGISDADFSETTVYLYFTPGKEKPVHWSRRNRNSTRYLFV